MHSMPSRSDDYQSKRNIAHLQSANLHLDNLLTYVKPYFILPESVIEVIGASATTYRAQLEQYVSSFQDKTLVYKLWSLKN